MITQEKLKSYLAYDEYTGIFTWISTNFVGKNCHVNTTQGYIKIQINNTFYYAHRLALIYMGNTIPKGAVIDHINGIRNDNCKSNLRIVSYAENSHNRNQSNKTSASKILGVSFHKASNKWRAAIHINKKQKHLGLYSSSAEAEQAYQVAKQHYFDNTPENISGSPKRKSSKA